MARFKLTLEYAGTRYSGWQVQKNARTVQEEVQRAVFEVSARRDFELYGSGRTDAGVHALAQVAHLDLETRLPTEALRFALNDHLSSDINILAVEKVTRNFHARHDAVARSYLYQVARRRTAFGKALVYWIKDPLSTERMREASRLFVGTKDFQSFSDDDPEEKSTSVRVERLDVAEDGDLILIRMLGSHFIWKMVRRVVGVLIEVGRGALQPADIVGFFAAKSELPARLTAPPSGLFLERVFYPGDRQDWPLRPVLHLASPASEPRGDASSLSGRPPSASRPGTAPSTPAGGPPYPDGARVRGSHGARAGRRRTRPGPS